MIRLIHLIIAARDAAAWLPQTFASISGQVLPSGWRLKVSLGIDACPDTLRGARRGLPPNATAHYFPTHCGPYVIFNTLARQTDCDLIARFDADDVMCREFLWHQVHALSHARRLQLAQTWSWQVDSRLRPLPAAPPSIGAGGLRRRPCDGVFSMTHALWERLGGFQPWWCSADSEFLLRATWAGAATAIVPAPLFLRRVHGASLTQARTTGLRSGLRAGYASSIEASRKRFARGHLPERVAAVVQPCFAMTR